MESMDPHGPRRFVVQHHELSAGGHWDLMLEGDAALATWQLAEPPNVAAGSPVSARRIGDHRKAYLDYEGPVSGGRGTVRIADAGRCEVMEAGSQVWRFRLDGRILRGTFELVRQGPDPQAWVLRRPAPPA